MKILRVFPRRTSYTPQDNLVRIGYPELWKVPADEVHISCVFSWDKHYCAMLGREWSCCYPIVKLGGPAYGCRSNQFTPGRYVKKGITFTSRGCDLNCPWCFVPKLEGEFRAIKNIAPGNIIQDNNILLADRKHLSKVFSMLKKQKGIRFLGGLDSRLLKDWHIEEMKSLRIKELWLSFDSWDRRNSIMKAVEKLRRAGFSRRQTRCYVLAGFNEPIQGAEDRLRLTYEAGALPYIQVYHPISEKKRMTGEKSREDNLFVRRWSRPAIIKSMMEAKK